MKFSNLLAIRVPTKGTPPEVQSLCRLDFLQAVQRVMPACGRYLRRYAGRLQDDATRKQVIRYWQVRFNLLEEWAFEFAWSTLQMWQVDPAAAERLEWFVGGSAHNVAGVLMPTFQLTLERDWHQGLDFAMFSSSLHGALDSALEPFREQVGAEDRTNKRRPKDLSRAMECLALRICKGVPPSQICRMRAYSRDWSTLSRDMKAAAELIGVRLPRRGRPKKNIAR